MRNSSSLPLTFLIFNILGGCYVTAKSNLIDNFFNTYYDFIRSHYPHKVLKFNRDILSPDNTTLFCTSGMHRFKDKFSDLSVVDTEFNIQKCLRLNDLDEVGDSTHYLTFHMLGMFSFRELSVKEAISFWLEFMQFLEIPMTHITLHPDKKSWTDFYPSDTNIVFDENNKWSDGNIGGYCTEFFVGDIEIGNIVNPLGTCIDVGFGLERLLNIKYNLPPQTRPEIIKEACESLIYSGVTIDHYKQGYILKKLITELVYSDVVLNHRFYDITKENQKKQYLMYKNESKKNRHRDKPPEYWKNTLGMDVNNLSKYESLF